MKHHTLTFCTLTLAAICGQASGATLLDATTINTPGGGMNGSYYVAQNFGNALANAVQVGAEGWDISSISTFYAPLGNPMAFITGARLFVAEYQPGVLPGDPFAASASVTVPVSVRTQLFTDPVAGWQRNAIVVEASGLDLHLAAGTYWIGLTPEIASTSNGSVMAWGARESLADRAIYYFGETAAWAPPYAGWTGPSAMMRIEGAVSTVPEPHTAAYLACGGALLLAWRGLRGARRA